MNKKYTVNAPPIFVIGNPRSGTTLLRLLLNSHSEIFIPPECGFVVWLYNKFQNWNTEDTNGKKLDLFLSDLYTTKKFETWSLQKEALKKYIIDKQPNSFGILASTIYCFYAASHKIKSKTWGDKNNFYIQHIPEILSLYPKARIILIIRDGRDVASSYLKLAKKNISSKYAPIFSTNIKEIALEWSSNNQIAINHLRESKANFLVIRYEDLVSNPTRKLHKICDFLNIQFEENMLDYYLDVENAVPSDFFQWKYKNKEPINTKSIGVYKRVLSKKQINEFNLISEDLLKEFNYISI